MSILYLMGSVIHHGTAFKEDYGVSYLEARNIDIPKDTFESNFLDCKRLNSLLRYARIGTNYICTVP